MKSIFSAALAATLLLSGAAFAGSHYTAYSASDDPARWYQPLETSRDKYDNAMREARNALADALRECRSARSARAACEADARREYRRDVSHARVHLEPARQV